MAPPAWNADLWSAQPAEGGRREGPELRNGSSRGGCQAARDRRAPGRSALSLRSAQRSRPEVGGPGRRVTSEDGGFSGRESR